MQNSLNQQIESDAAALIKLSENFCRFVKANEKKGTPLRPLTDGDSVRGWHLLRSLATNVRLLGEQHAALINRDPGHVGEIVWASESLFGSLRSKRMSALSVGPGVETLQLRRAANCIIHASSPGHFTWNIDNGPPERHFLFFAHRDNSKRRQDTTLRSFTSARFDD